MNFAVNDSAERNFEAYGHNFDKCIGQRERAHIGGEEDLYAGGADRELFLGKEDHEGVQESGVKVFPT